MEESSLETLDQSFYSSSLPPHSSTPPPLALPPSLSSLLTTSSPFVLGVHVGSVVQQELHHCHPVVAGGEVQRRGVTSLQVAAVDVLGRAQ